MNAGDTSARRDHEEAQERATRRDRRFFRRNPGVRRYTRRIIPGEAPIHDPRITHVVVERLAPGIRSRSFRSRRDAEGTV
jgi:hypothetical protein